VSVCVTPTSHAGSAKGRQAAGSREVGYTRPEPMATIKLGELCIKAGVLTEVQLKTALAEQKKWGGRLGDILVRMDMITEDTLVRALSRQLGLSIVNLDAIEKIPANVRERVSAKLARDLHAVPIGIKEDTKALIVAMSEPQNIQHLDQLRAVNRGMKIIASTARPRAGRCSTPETTCPKSMRKTAKVSRSSMRRIRRAAGPCPPGFRTN
jgi:hypothetical protein